MKDTLFLDLITDNKLIAEVVKNNSFDNINLSGLDFIKHWDDVYTFKNLQIGNLIFKSLDIRISPNGIFITIFSDETTFFDNPLVYFGTEGIMFEIEPFIDGNKKISEYRRKLGQFQLHNMAVNLSVLKSEAYGSKIKMALIK